MIAIFGAERNILTAICRQSKWKRALFNKPTLLFKNRIIYVSLSMPHYNCCCCCYYYYFVYMIMFVFGDFSLKLQRIRFNAMLNSVTSSEVTPGESKASWLSGRVLVCGAEGSRIVIWTGPKISCYACCALGQGTLLSFAPLHPGELSGYRPWLGK